MNVAIILAAGSGLRFDNEESKLFMLIKNKPLIYYTIKSFEDIERIDQILIVSKKGEINKFKDLINTYKFKKITSIVEGGSTRQESSFNGLNYLSSKLKSDDIVFIHDGARPLVDKEIIENHITLLRKYDATTTAIKSINTIAISKDDKIINEFLDRNEIYQIQTPQAFKFGLIFQAHKTAIEKKTFNFTDDTQLITNLGQKVGIVLGDHKLLKITTKNDIKFLESLL